MPASASPKPVNGFRVGGSLQSPRTIFTAGGPALLGADGTDTAVVATTAFVSEMHVPSACFTTGAAVFNGSVVTNGNTVLALFNSAGVIVASTTAAASAGVDVYQRFAWSREFITTVGTATAVTAPIFLTPGTYYLAALGSSTSDKFNTYAVGNHGAGTVTVVNATAFITTSLTITLPTTFTAAQGCIGGLY